MNTLTKIVVAVFWSNVVKCEVGKMFSYDKGEVKDTRSHSQVH